MLTRRNFLASSMSTLVLYLELSGSLPAFAKKPKKGKNPKIEPISGPHVLARDSWPPAIVPDYIGLDKRGLLCLLDEFGRMSIIDLKKVNTASGYPEVIAELSALGKRVAGLTVDQSMAHVVTREPLAGSGQKLVLVSIDLKVPEEPQIICKTELENLAEGSAIVAERGIIVIAGTDKDGKSKALILEEPRKGEQSARIATNFNCSKPVTAMHLERRELTVLGSDGRNSLIDVYKLAQPNYPERLHQLELEGDYTFLTRLKTSMFVVGQDSSSSEGKMQARSISMKPAPHAISITPLDKMNSVLAAKATSDRLMVLGRSTDDKLVLNFLSIDKHSNLQTDQVMRMPSEGSGGLKKAGIVEDKGTLYVACGWSGVQVLKGRKSAWQQQYSYKIPRLAAASIATWGQNVVMVGADLVLYDISNPEQPVMVKSVPCSPPIRSMVGAGSFILTLSKDQLALRKMASLDSTVATCQIAGNDLAFDKSEHKAFVIKAMDKISRIQPIKVYADNLEALPPFDVQGNFGRLRAFGGLLAASSVDDGVCLFKPGAQLAPIGQRRFDHLAIRDICLTEKHLLATAIDRSGAKGFLLVLDKDDAQLNVKGTIDLPHNAVAVSALEDMAVAVGRDETGKDRVSIIDLSNPNVPTVVKTLKSLEAASAVTIQSKLALVGGRGLEIVTLA